MTHTRNFRASSDSVRWGIALRFGPYSKDVQMLCLMLRNILALLHWIPRCGIIRSMHVGFFLRLALTPSPKIIWEYPSLPMFYFTDTIGTQLFSRSSRKSFHYQAFTTSMNSPTFIKLSLVCVLWI